MKKIRLLLIPLMLSASLLAQPLPDSTRLGTNGKRTRYWPGFSYTTPTGEKATLLRWIGAMRGVYRWETQFEFMGKTYKGWTDDPWIDVARGKAYVNEQTNRIMYYDSLKAPKQ